MAAKRQLDQPLSSNTMPCPLAWRWRSAGVTLGRGRTARRSANQSELQYRGEASSLLWLRGQKTELGIHHPVGTAAGSAMSAFSRSRPTFPVPPTFVMCQKRKIRDGGLAGRSRRCNEVI
jgi:hypothetical protein